MKHLYYAANAGAASLGELFDGQAYARNADPDTSREAAECVRGDRATRMEQKALQVVRDREPRGVTNFEISAATGVSLQTITPRMKPLRLKGLVYDSGKRRPGATNRPCIVWRATT